MWIMVIMRIMTLKMTINVLYAIFFLLQYPMGYTYDVVHVCNCLGVFCNVLVVPARIEE